jgi:Holliday junction resolvase
MAATKESLVKKKIHAVLKERGAYAVNYIGGAYANNGTPDILVCFCGRFIAIEAKAGRGRPTALQIKNLRDIEHAGGVSLVINETNLEYLMECLDAIKAGHTPRSNYGLFERQDKGTDE